MGREGVWKGRSTGSGKGTVFDLSVIPERLQLEVTAQGGGGASSLGRAEAARGWIQGESRRVKKTLLLRLGFADLSGRPSEKSFITDSSHPL